MFDTSWLTMYRTYSLFIENIPQMGHRYFFSLIKNFREIDFTKKIKKYNKE